MGRMDRCLSLACRPTSTFLCSQTYWSTNLFSSYCTASSSVACCALLSVGRTWYRYCFFGYKTRHHEHNTTCLLPGNDTTKRTHRLTHSNRHRQLFRDKNTKRAHACTPFLFNTNHIFSRDKHTNRIHTTHAHTRAHSHARGWTSGSCAVFSYTLSSSF